MANLVHAREGRGADLARPTVRSRRPALSKEDLSARRAKHRRARQRPLSASEISRPDHPGRIRACRRQPGDRQRSRRPATEDRFRTVDWRRPQQEQVPLLPRTRWQEDLRRMAIRLRPLEAWGPADASRYGRSWRHAIARTTTPATVRIPEAIVGIPAGIGLFEPILIRQWIDDDTASTGSAVTARGACPRR